MNTINYDKLNRWEIIELANKRIEALLEEIYYNSIEPPNSSYEASASLIERMKQSHITRLEKELIK